MINDEANGETWMKSTLPGFALNINDNISLIYLKPTLEAYSYLFLVGEKEPSGELCVCVRQPTNKEAI